jgi:hypothetical protein
MTPMQLTQYQEDLIKSHFAFSPDLIELTRLAFNNPRLDARSPEGRAVRKFIVGKDFINIEPQLDFASNPTMRSPSGSPMPSPSILNRNHSSLYHPQKTAAESILDVWYFRKRQWAILVGKCRSGKMNTIWHTAGRFFEESNNLRPEKRKLVIYIFSGSSTSALNDAKDTWKSYNSNLENLPICQLNYFLDGVDKSEEGSLTRAVLKHGHKNNILILHQPNLTSYGDQLNHLLDEFRSNNDDVVIFLDECDSYINKSGKVDAFLSDNSIYLSSLNCRPPTFKVLSISATLPAYLEKAQSETDYLEGKKCVPVDENKWDHVNPMIVALLIQEGYVSLQALLSAGRIKQCENCFELNGDGDLILSPWFVDKMKNAPCHLWNQVRHFGPAQLEALKKGEDQGLFTLHQITAQEGKNTDDMINLMNAVPLQNCATPNLIAVNQMHGRGTEGPREKFGYIFETRSSKNESLDWQRYMRACGYFNYSKTEFTLFGDLALVDDIIDSEGSIDEWANRKTTEKPRLLVSNHYLGNAHGRLDYKSVYTEIPKGKTVKEYLKEERETCPGLSYDNAHRQQGEDKNLYAASIAYNGAHYGLKRSGGTRLIVILEDPDPTREVPESHIKSAKEVKDTLLDPESAQCQQGLKDTGLSYLDWKGAIEEKRIVQRIYPIEGVKGEHKYREGSGITDKSGLSR